MTIPRTLYNPGGQFPRDYGLPTEAEVASWAAEWFPEFSASAPIRNAAYSGHLLSSAVDGGRNLAAPGSAVDTVFSPRVIPLDAETAPYPAPQAAAPPPASDPSLSRALGAKSLSAIRSDFPILAEKVNGHDLVWLDNAATTQKPQAVIDRLSHYYRHENSNIHRGVHELADRSTDAYEEARLKVARFIGAASADNIVFVRGTTEGINLAAHAYVKPLLRPGDEIVLTLLEHHANIVPWQIIAGETGAFIRVAPIDQSGQIILSEYEKLFSGRTRFVSAAHVSNALGTVAPVAEMIRIAHNRGVPVLIDGAQSISHIPVNVSALDADFFVFSGHKIFAPTGIGALYGKSAVLEAARPYQGGGNMISDVTFERTLYQKAPAKFEAGTGNIADAVGLGAALDYVSAIGMENIAAWEHELIQYGIQELAKIPGLHLVGRAAEKTSVLSFVLEGRDNEEVGKYLNAKGIAVRAGHHCAQPVHRFFGLEGTVRPSLAFYNSFGDIDKLAAALREIAG
jgi:cysteine desulfurase/selenocysteine lyase